MAWQPQPKLQEQCNQNSYKSQKFLHSLKCNFLNIRPIETEKGKIARYTGFLIKKKIFQRITYIHVHEYLEKEQER